MQEDIIPTRTVDIRARNLRLRYGLSVETYDDLLEAQRGVCALCEKAPVKHRLAVDHDHETGRIRGLLCAPCNKALGILGDSVSGLQRAIAYIDG